MMKRFVLMISVFTAVAGVTACTWVKPTTSASRVSVATPEQANYCEKLGQTRVTTQNRVAIFDRNDKKVAEELTTMARNSAADMGGNAVIPLTQVADGKQTFAILRCSNL